MVVVVDLVAAAEAARLRSVRLAHSWAAAFSEVAEAGLSLLHRPSAPFDPNPAFAAPYLRFPARRLMSAPIDLSRRADPMDAASLAADVFSTIS